MLQKTLHIDTIIKKIIVTLCSWTLLNDFKKERFMRNTFYKLLIICAFFTLPTRVCAVTDGTEDAAAGAYKQFSFDLFQRVDKQHAGQNVVISPLSAWYALGMLQQGAANTTLSGINQALYLPGDYADLGIYNQQLNKQLMTPIGWNDMRDEWFKDEKTVFELANSYWADDEITCLESYQDALKTYYSAEYNQIDLQKQSDLELVDQWVNEKTHGNIPSLNLIPNKYMRMLLINALYFKASWGAPINSLIYKFPFTNASGEKKIVNSLLGEGYFNYAEVDGFQAIRLGLGNEDDRFSMTLFLGNQPDDILTGDAYLAAMNAMKSESIRLKMPCFETDFEVNLNETLMDMGMEEAFTFDADFSRMSTRSLLVSLIKQLTHIGVDEKGVEASAVTVGMEESVGGKEPEYKNIAIDRPFFFTIEDNLCGKVMFIGQIQYINEENVIEDADQMDETVSSSPKAYYDMMGRRLHTPSHGWNIVNENGRKRVVYFNHK